MKYQLAFFEDNLHQSNIPENFFDLITLSFAGYAPRVPVELPSARWAARQWLCWRYWAARSTGQPPIESPHRGHEATRGKLGVHREITRGWTIKELTEGQAYRSILEENINIDSSICLTHIKHHIVILKRWVKCLDLWKWSRCLILGITWHYCLFC